MKKRLLAVFLAMVALVSCFALSVGAEEATEEVTEEAAMFNMLDDREPSFDSYYCFTLEDGDAFDVSKLVSSSGSVRASVYIAALNGRYTSGKDAGNVDFSADNTKLAYKINAPGQILWEENEDESNGYYYISVDLKDGYIDAIRGVDRGANKGAHFKTLIVKIGLGYWEDGVYVDNTEEVEAFVKGLESIGIEVTKSTYGGIVETMFSGFGAAIGGLAGGLKTSFNRIVYANGIGGAFSPLVIFIFVVAGLGLATAILYKIFGMVRQRKG